MWQPEDDWTLFVANGELLPFFPCVRNLAPCDAADTQGDSTCFYAEVRLAGIESAWERVVLKGFFVFCFCRERVVLSAPS